MTADDFHHAMRWLRDGEHTVKQRYKVWAR
jgi:hypothetical protein